MNATSACRLQSLEVLFTPAEFETLRGRDLSRTTCVVFDILRATTTMITALANGADAIIPVAEIAEALALRRKQPDVLLAGERNGLRIRAEQTDGIDFDLGNSPREFTADRVAGRTIVTTTTNGTRALRACARAQMTFVASFLNLSAVADRIALQSPEALVLVCSGTFEEAAYEDVLAAGALLELLGPWPPDAAVADTAPIARQIWEAAKDDLPAAMRHSRNARKLLGHPDLAGDVAFSLQRDTVPFAAAQLPEGSVRRLEVTRSAW